MKQSSKNMKDNFIVYATILKGLITHKVSTLVTKSQLDPQLQNYLNWVLFFENLFQFAPFHKGIIDDVNCEPHVSSCFFF